MSSLNINSPPRLKSESSLGRLPWFDKTGAPASPYLIGIAGGSGSGKTSVANSILKTLNIPWIALLQMDSYYKPLTPDQSELAFKNEFDFDHPSCFDYETLLENLTDLKNNRAVNVPIYDFKTHSRSSKTTQIYGANVIIFEGIFTLFNPQVRKLFNLTIFVDTDSDIRLARRLKRDVAERSRDVIGVLKQYISFVKPSFDLYVKQTMKYANIILPRGLDNVAAINVITRHVFERLNDRGIMFLRNELATMEVEEFTENVVVLESDQIKGMHTIIRNPDCTRHDFVFYADRISRLVIECALSLLPYKSIDIITPLNYTYEGKKLDANVCGVSIVRSGATMEKALRSIIHDIAIGKILIQTNEKSGEPTLHYIKLPKNINEFQVILCDATLGTGAASMMAIRVLIEFGVLEQHIVFVCLIGAPQGVSNIMRCYPKVRIVCSMVDKGLNERFHILPGIGNFGRSYFGC